MMFWSFKQHTIVIIDLCLVIIDLCLSNIVLLKYLLVTQVFNIRVIIKLLCFFLYYVYIVMVINIAYL